MNNSQPICASLEASRDRVKLLDQCINEYREKVGEEILDELKSLVLHQAVDADTAINMSAKDINTDDYTAMKRYIETRFLEDLGCRPVNVDIKGFNTVDESKKGEPQKDEWDEWGGWTGDPSELNSMRGKRGMERNM